MANNITGRVWTLDTPGTIWTGPPIKIVQIEFVGYTVVTDAIVLTDAIGRDLWEARGAADFSVVRSGKIGWSNGLILVSLTPGSNGVVKVYIE